MSEQMQQPDQTPATPFPALDEAERRDVLITRIIDAEGSDRGVCAWSEFARLAGDSAEAWRELAQAQREHAALVRAVEPRLAFADHVELPAPPAHQTAGDVVFRVSRWSGWAAAAVVAMAWLGAQMAGVAPKVSPSGMTNAASILPVGAVPVSSTQEAISAYKELGQRSGIVLGEIPERVIIESRPVAGGRGFEVVYLRQFMERAHVPELYQLNRDDSGQQGMLVPVPQPTVRSVNRID